MNSFKASGELLDPDHYIRARNNPPIPNQAIGKEFIESFLF